MSLTITTIVVYLTLASLLFTIADVTKIKKENEKLKEEIEIIKKQLSKTMGVSPGGPIDDELRQLINDGSDVKAVKKAREIMGLSLLEGKQYIDALKVEEKQD